MCANSQCKIFSFRLFSTQFLSPALFLSVSLFLSRPLISLWNYDVTHTHTSSTFPMFMQSQLAFVPYGPIPWDGASSISFGSDRNMCRPEMLIVMGNFSIGISIQNENHWLIPNKIPWRCFVASSRDISGHGGGSNQSLITRCCDQSTTGAFHPDNNINYNVNPRDSLVNSFGSAATGNDGERIVMKDIFFKCDTHCESTQCVDSISHMISIVSLC